MGAQSSLTVAALPETMNGTISLIMRGYEQAADTGHRSHLGASLIGHACERALWMTFRWVAAEKFSGRMLRLFEYGQQAEPRLNAELRAIGVTVYDLDENGNQWRVAAVGGHFGGSMDGAVLGLPEAPTTWHVLEEKTHNAKSFKELETKGVKLAKPLHFFQMQTYMGLTGMTRAFYLAECKDNSALYCERLEADALAFAQVMARAERVITASGPPSKLSEDPAWFECKFCKFHAVCHVNAAPEVNCRTCAHSTPTMAGDGEWSCSQPPKPVVIPITTQRTGCNRHLYIPPLLERIGQPADSDDDGIKYLTKNGRHFTNGPPPGLSSADIYAAPDKTILGQLTA